MSFLPGMHPGSEEGEEALTTISMVGSGTSTSNTITSSVTIEAGDLLVINGDVLSSAAPPPNTLQLFQPGANTSTSWTGGYYRLANGSEGTTVAGFSGKTIRQNLYVFRGDIPITTTVLQSGVSQTTSGNPTAQVVSSSEGVVPLVVIGCYISISGGTVSPRTMTPNKDGEVNVAVSCYLAYKIYNSSPANVTVDMDDEGDGNYLGSCYIECS